MLIDILLVLAGATAGLFGTRKFWPKQLIDFQEKVEVPVIPFLDDEESYRRFHVIFATDQGAAARQLYEKVKARDDAIIKFLDEGHCRGTKVSEED